MKGRIVQHDKNEKLMVKSYLGDFIAREVKLRKARGEYATIGLIIEEIANYVGISTNAIERLRRMSVPMMPTAVKVAEYFNMTLDQIWEIQVNPMWEDDRKKCKKCDRTHYVSGLCYGCYSIRDRNKKANCKNTN